MRPILNKMDDETFELFIKYHLATCERQELIGASSHTIDILKNSVTFVALFSYYIFHY